MPNNTDMFPLTEVNTLFKFSFFSSRAFCLSQGLIEHTMRHIYLSHLLRTLLAMTVPQIFIIRDDLDSLEVDWPGI